MKEIRTIKMVESIDVKFVADDGKEFIGENAERDCRDYERTKDRKKVEQAFARLDFVEYKMPFVSWFSDDYGLYRIVLNSKSDYIAMIDYFKIVWNTFDVTLDEPTSYPYTMTISSSYDYVTEYNGDIKTELQKALEQFK